MVLTGMREGWSEGGENMYMKNSENLNTANSAKMSYFKKLGDLVPQAKNDVTTTK